MCEAIEGIRNDGVEEGIKKGIEKGIEKGIKIGELQILIGLVKDGLLSIEEAAKRVNMTVSEFEGKTGLKA